MKRTMQNRQKASPWDFDVTLVERGDEKDISALRDGPHVRKLRIKSCRISSLEVLAEFKSLEYLDLQHCRKVDALSPLMSLKRLKGLMLHNLPAVTGLDDLPAFSSLREFVIWGSVSGAAHGKKGWKLDALHPITRLPKLRVLCLGGLDVVADDLATLAEVSSLRTLEMGNKLFSAQAMARLRGLRPDLKCSVLIPWSEHPFDESMIRVHGKGSKDFRIGKSRSARERVEETIRSIEEQWARGVKV